MFPFRILAVMDEQKPWWFAEQLGGGDFRLTDSSTLGGVSIKPMTSMPSCAPRADGTRPVVFAFYPANRRNISVLSVGDDVELVAERIGDSPVT